jgi:phenylacetate-CoA ligase
MNKKWIRNLMQKKNGIYFLDEYNLFKNITCKDDLIKFQYSYLTKLLVHAGERVPYYKHLLKNFDIISDGIVNIANFQNIPLMTKEIIRSNQKSLISSDYTNRKFFYNTSGGSTGEPVKLMQDKVYEKWGRATTFYYYRDILGIDWYEVKKINLWGSLQEIVTNNLGIKSKIGHWINNIVFLNSFRMTERDMEQYIRVINSYKPELIHGYAGSLHELSKFAIQNHLPLHSPKYIISAAETLRDEMRADIEEAFGTKVYNYYGSREVSHLAGECTRGLMHTFSFWNYLEVLDENNQPVKEGEEGKVVVTNLFNYSMPLIRYEIGDLAIRGPDQCTCGNILPTLKTVSGRTSDPFILEDGTIIYGSFFNQLFFFKNWVHSFQIIQEDYKKIKIVVVLQDVINPQEQTTIEENIRLVMGNDCAISWEIVDEIPKTTSGKYLYRISHVWRELQKSAKK